jgi:hypothetical protein
VALLQVNDEDVGDDSDLLDDLGLEPESGRRSNRRQSSEETTVAPEETGGKAGKSGRMPKAKGGASAARKNPGKRGRLI